MTTEAAVRLMVRLVATKPDEGQLRLEGLVRFPADAVEGIVAGLTSKGYAVQKVWQADLSAEEGQPCLRDRGWGAGVGPYGWPGFNRNA